MILNISIETSTKEINEFTLVEILKGIAKEHSHLHLPSTDHRGTIPDVEEGYIYSPVENVEPVFKKQGEIKPYSLSWNKEHVTWMTGGKTEVLIWGISDWETGISVETESLGFLGDFLTACKDFFRGYEYTIWAD